MPNGDRVYVEKLTEIRNQLHQEYAQIQIVGVELTPEEKRRSEVLSSAMQFVDQAIQVLEQPAPPIEPPTEILIRDGSYIASNDQLSCDLRIDAAEMGILSMDIFYAAGDSRSYVASIRSNPGDNIQSNQQRIGIIGQDAEDNQTSGILELTPASDTQLGMSLTLESGLTGITGGMPILLAARWQSDSMRSLGIEIEQEENITGLEPYEFEGQMVTMESCFAEAGIEIFPAGRHDQIPEPQFGWDDAQLHGLMSQFADESLASPSWILHLLLLSEASDDRLLGVMFDTGRNDANNLPRQGAAVFENPISSHRAGQKRKMIQTVVHELGHALNLAHRFEREIGRADSTSFMNYDWRYKGGHRATEYWNKFRFTFDADEVRFLRHAPLPLILPGEAEFHTARYWSEGTGGYSPYVPEITITDLSLSLAPPPTGPIFDFGTPVFLSVSLTNNSSQSLDIPGFFLDPKSGFLEILVKRQAGPNRRDSDWAKFRPLFTRCYDRPAGVADIVNPGQSMSNNLNLTFGSAGFTFAEPGNYEVTTVLAIYDRIEKVDYIVKSNPLAIRIAYPHSPDDERDALALFQNDVGYYFALGGSDIFPDAADRLEAIREKRQRERKKITDPLVAYISRCQAINLSREFVTFKNGEYKKRAAKASEAISILDMVDKTAKNLFDSETLKSTTSLAHALKKDL